MFGILKGARNRPADRVVSTLQGAYDIRDDALIGIVEKVPPFFSGAGMRVEAIRGGDVIAGCDAVDVPGEPRMSFTLPFAERFTVAELAREQVRIAARNSRGDAGALALNGATRVELIREYMGVPVQPILNLSFAANGNARPYLGVGWSWAEASFTWATDDLSVVNLPGQLEPGIYFVRMRYGAFISMFVRSQAMEVLLNEHPVGAVIEDWHALQFREFRFQLQPKPGERVFSLRFEHGGAARPSDAAGTQDRRRLAFRFCTLSILREL